jgi:hypothetical protein
MVTSEFITRFGMDACQVRYLLAHDVVVPRWLVSLAVPRGAVHSKIDGRDWASVEASKWLGILDDVAHASFWAAQRCARC